MDQPIPVLCDLCRATGLAGAAPFADLADLLSFTPVPRRAHVNGWDAERQRAFIAALVATGSPRRAASAIGKHAFGAEQLRRARGGQSFAAAWDAALELSRERELAGLREGLTELAAEHDTERARRRSALLPAADRAAFADQRPPGRGRNLARLDPEEAAALRREVLEVQENVRLRLTRSRRLYLALIAQDPAKCAAWDTLVGPVDWKKAALGQPQADEPFHDPLDDDDPEYVRNPARDHAAPPNFHNPDMLLVAEGGLIADLTGGPDPLDALRHALDPPIDDSTLSEEEQAAVAAYRDALKEAGWEEDDAGNLWSPDPPGATK